jgi:hypothetical protein
MKSRLSCMAACVLLAAACDGVTGPGDYNRLRTDTSPPEFSAWLATVSQPAPLLHVAGDVGEISAGGPLATPYPCYDVAGYARIRGKEVDLDIVARRRDGVCITVPAIFGYGALIRGLESGIYTVRVTHAVDGRTERVLEDDVTVH